jgi:hypothetical protein
MQALAAQHIGNTAATRGSIVSTPPLGIVYANDELTVIGSCDAGYAIVVNDDNKGTVIGYSTSPFNVANTALLWYLQAAEEAGIPIDQAKISAGITAILEADRAEKKQLLNDLLNEINGCNK